MLFLETFIPKKVRALFTLKRFIVYAGMTQLVLISLYLYKSNFFIKYAHAKQKNEKLRAQLLERRNVLMSTRAHLNSQSHAKAYALQAGMVPLTLKNMQTLKPT